ncbi:PKD domain-containing protein [Sporocytophaga myxococcoides]|uniref:PKD domain-containing protein n=1 Tax=Sporocytophaga myxococcoides TaxID=153721 RepID=A0A098LMN9_9BACT|nr:T9SS type A sorting domain-containing protein [Sporocytophaga myxococcoides]GAL87358.1 PKD domain-containing protein [Sporocytophaga myxococcoides]
MKNFFLFLTCFTLSTSLFSQNWQWAHNPGGTSFDQGEAVYVDGAGNSYVTGGIIGPAEFAPYSISPTGGGLDAFICKYDPTGKVVWVKSDLSLSGGDAGTDVKVDNDGNIYVAGYGYGIIFLNKYKPDGTSIWKVTKNITTTSKYYLDIDDLGNVYLTGDFSGTIDFGSGPIKSYGGIDFFIAKFDPSGVNKWVRSGGGISTDGSRGIYTDRNGNSTIVGSFSTNISIGTYSYTNGGAFLARYNSDGELIWVNRMTTSGVNPFDLDIDNDGSIYITGRLRSNKPVIFGALSPVVPVSGNFDYYNVFIAKYSSSGSAIWVKQAGSPGWWSEGKKVRVNKTKNTIVLFGHFSKSLDFDNNQVLSGANYDDLFLVEFDNAGTLLSKTSMGGPDYEIASGLDIDNTGNIFISGTLDYTSGGQGNLNTKFGNTILTKNSQNDDIFIAKYGPDIQIHTGNPELNFFCSGQTFNLPFTKQGKFNNGNSFQVQLSDSSGSFLSPTIVGSIADTLAGSISVTIPTEIKAGYQYRLRIVSTTPSITGSDNGINLLINYIKAWNSGAVCVNTPAQLFASPAPNAVYHWSGPNLFSSDIQNPVIPTPVKGNYFLTTKVDGCNDINSFVPITVTPIPVAEITSNNSPFMCIPGPNFEMQANEIAGATYTWTGPYNFSASGRVIARHSTFTEYAGTYTVTVSVNGCKASASANVSYSYNPDPEIVREGNYLMCILYTNGSFQWHRDGVPINGATSNTYFATSNGNYTVSLINTQGCYGMSAPFYFEASSAPEWEWVKQGYGASGSGTTVEDVFNSVTVDSLGYIYAGGCHGLSINYDYLYSPGSSRRTGIIVKYDDQGQALSLIRMTGAYNNVLGVKVDNKNDLIVLGSFTSNTTLDTINLTSNTTEIFIAKYNSAGKIQWAKKLGSNNNSSIKIGKNGSIYFSGNFTSSVNVDGKIVNIGPAIIKLNPNGSLNWVSQPTTGTYSLFKFTLTQNENIWLVGNNSGAVQFNNFTLSNTGNFLANLDSTGTILSIFNIGTGGGINDINLDSQDNVYLIGNINNSIKFGTTAITGYGVFLSKFNASGNLLWAKKIFSADNDVSGRLLINNDNIYIIGGLSGTIGSFKIPWQRKDKDLYVSQMNVDGDFVWIKTCGGKGLDRATDATFDRFGNLYTVGLFNESFNFSYNKDNVISYGGSDPFITKINNVFQQRIITESLPSPICAGSTLDLHILSQYLDPAKRYTAQLSDNQGNFARPIEIGTMSNTSDNKISISFPDSLNTNGARKIRIGSDDLSLTSSTETDVIIKKPMLTMLPFTGEYCQGSLIKVTYTTECLLDSKNTFTAELSDKNGDFSDPLIIGNLKSVYTGNIMATIPHDCIIGTAYRIRVKASNPDIKSPDNNSDLSINLTPDLTVIQPDTICTGNEIDLTNYYSDIKSTNGNVTFWKDINTLIKSNRTVLENGTYYVLKTTDKGCSDKKSINVGFHPKPLIYSTDVKVCEGQLANITKSLTDINNTPGSISYWLDKETSVLLDKPEAAPAPGVYYIKKASKENCKDITSINVISHLYPDLKTTDQLICGGTKASLRNAYIDLNNTEGGASYWKDAAGTIQVIGYDAIKEPGTYYIRKTTTTSLCSSTAPVQVKFYQTPNLETFDIEICSGVSTDLTAAYIDRNDIEGNVTYWKDINASVTLNDPEFITKEGIYYIKKTDTSGVCSDIKAIEVNMVVCTDVKDKKTISKVNLYPVPSSGTVNIEFHEGLIKKDINLKLLNSVGETLINYILPTAQGTHVLDLKNINAGTYMLHISGDDYYNVSEIILLK